MLSHGVSTSLLETRATVDFSRPRSWHETPLTQLAHHPLTQTKVLPISKGIFAVLHPCCQKSATHKRYITSILDAFARIQKVNEGSRLVESIALSAHHLVIMRHLSGDPCHDERPYVLHGPSAFQMPGSDSLLLFPLPEVIQRDRFVTRHHFKNCQSKGITSSRCWDEGSPCNRHFDIDRVLVHELTHVENGALGLYTCNPPSAPEWVNTEEESAIHSENLFVEHRLALAIGRGTLFQQTVDRHLRHGHVGAPEPSRRQSFDPFSPDDSPFKTINDSKVSAIARDEGCIYVIRPISKSSACRTTSVEQMITVARIHRIAIFRLTGAMASWF